MMQQQQQQQQRKYVRPGSVFPVGELQLHGAACVQVPTPYMQQSRWPSSARDLRKAPAVACRKA